MASPQLPWWYEPLTRVITAVVIVTVAYVVVRIYRSIVRKTLGSRFPVLARRAIVLGAWLIWAIAILIALPSIGLETTILTYVFLLFGLAIVLASKDVLANLIAEQVMTEFKIGDWIIIDGHHGRVVEMTPMNIVIATVDNKRVIIPNSFFSSHIVVNQTAYGGVCVDMPVTVAGKHDLSTVEKELLKIGGEVGGGKVEDRAPQVIVDNVEEGAVRLVLRLWMLNPARAETLRSDANRKINGLLQRLEER